MNSRTLTARVKDFDSLIMDGRDAVPIRAVRKLYKLTLELVDLVNHTEGRLEDAKDKLLVKPEPKPVVDVNIYAKQMKEMAAELVELKKELAELKEENRYLKLPKQTNKPVAPKKPVTPPRNR